jgi:hypothetical protein
MQAWENSAPRPPKPNGAQRQTVNGAKPALPGAAKRYPEPELLVDGIPRLS